MEFKRITKLAEAATPRPNLEDYDAVIKSFTWKDAEEQLARLPGGALNIAHEALDAHVNAGRGGRLALRWLAKDGGVQDFSYAELASETARFASVLQSLGVEKGERVYSLLGRVPDLYIAALGALRAGAVFCPLFSAFGPEPIRTRIEIGDGRVLVTTKVLYEKKIAAWRHEARSLNHVLIIDDDGQPPDGAHALAPMMAEADPAFEPLATKPTDMALLHFTSGTTGKPKGAVHVHGAVVTHYLTGYYALDFQEGDVFWCTADPGWVTGTSYGIISPLVNGVTLIVDEAEFDADRWCRILEEQKVNVWYTAPTAIRMLMKAGDNLIKSRDLSSLRFMASVGEPLNPEAVIWSHSVFGMPFHDNWWQTETGGIMIANYASMDVKPGSMGRPLPGVEAAIVEQTATGDVRVIEEPMTSGELALRVGWPSMFRSYLHNEERYKKAFADGWYLSGDLAMKDEEGYYWFVGRADDMIKSAGHLIGPFEVESVLIAHEAIAEAAVIGVPDERAGELVKAFVTLNTDYAWSDELRKSVLGHARKTLGPAIAPREIESRQSLPKTRSGKIMRRLLKARELGLPEGDTSTLETEER